MMPASETLDTPKSATIWPMVRLGDVAKTSSGGTPKRTSASYYGGGIPWVKSGELGDSTVYETSETISQAGLDNSSAKLFPKGTLCVALYGATVGKLGVLGIEAATNQAVCGIFLPPEIDTRFAYRFLESKRRQLAESAKGGAQPNISQEIIRDLQFPLPPLPEQRRIVAEIEQQFTRLDAGVAALRRVQANLKRYRAAVLKAACQGHLVPTEAAWPVKSINVAITSLDQGWSPKCESEPSSNPETWAVIKTTAIQPLHFREDENKTLPAALKPRPHLALQTGDLLITRAGPRNRVGVACAVKSSRPRLMLCDKAYRLRSKPDIASPAFLELVLNAPHVVDALDKLKTGISDSGLNLTQNRFRELQIPLPPLAEQTRIVAEVERRLSVVDELESVVQTNLLRATRLRQAVLQKHFIRDPGL